MVSLFSKIGSISFWLKFLYLCTLTILYYAGVLALLGYLFYRLLSQQGVRERVRAEKKLQRQMRKEKKGK